MKLEDFVKNHNVDYSYNRVAESFLLKIEQTIGVEIGQQLKNYIINYGYLGYKHVELFGVNDAQKMNSDLVQYTIMLHQRCDITKELIAIEDQGDGDYYLVDSEDKVYRFIEGSKSISSTNMLLNEYILNRFLSV